MKKYLSIIAAALMVAAIAVSCKKDGKEKQFSPYSIEDFKGTVWVGDGGSPILAFDSTLPLVRAYVLNAYGKIAYQSSAENPEFDAELKEVRLPSARPTLIFSGAFFISGKTKIMINGNKAVSYACNDDWTIKMPENPINLTLNRKFNLNSLKFANEYVPEGVDLGEMTADDGSTVHVKWAEFNLGADDEEAYGLYYAWGELEQKPTCSIFNYLYEDNPSILPADRDAATMRLGAPWRMPTETELQALFNTKKDASNFSWTYGGTSKCWCVKRLTGECAGNFILLPLAGFISADGYKNSSAGFYWGSSIAPDKNDRASCLYLLSPDITGTEQVFYEARSYGQTIRPVCDL